MSDDVNRPLEDALGNLIKVGDVVMYPGRQGSSIWNSFSIVREIVVGEDWAKRPYRRLKVTNVAERGWHKKEVVVRNTTVYCLDRVVVLSRTNLKPTSEIAKTLLSLL
jgi:hypothetical protein